MRVLTVMVIGIAVARYAHAEVSVNVYRCDGETPLDLLDPNTPEVYSHIMVGTHLVLVVESDAGGHWWGSLELSRQDWERGKLAGRGYDPDSPLRFEGSCLEAAGLLPTVAFRTSPYGIGFQLNTHQRTAVAGQWFVLDYHAERVGPCDIGLFDLTGNLTVPTATLSFTHVPSRDLDSDTLVNFEDFAVLASHWRHAAGLDPNFSPTCDIGGNGLVDPYDLALFCEYWLERTDCNEPVAKLHAAQGL